MRRARTGGNKWFPDVVGGLHIPLRHAPAALGTNVPLVDARFELESERHGHGFRHGLAGPGPTTTAFGTTGLGFFGYTPSPRRCIRRHPNRTFQQREHLLFPHSLQLTNNAANVAFVVTNDLSDGAIYYLNGAEVKRVRMPAGPVAYADSATGTNSVEGTASVFAVMGGALCPVTISWKWKRTRRLTARRTWSLACLYCRLAIPGDDPEHQPAGGRQHRGRPVNDLHLGRVRQRPLELSVV